MATQNLIFCFTVYHQVGENGPFGPLALAVAVKVLGFVRGGAQTANLEVYFVPD